MNNEVNKSVKILGLMTGSSADGLDTCLVQFDGEGRSPTYTVIESGEVSYPDKFKKAFRNPLDLSNDQISALDHELGLWFAQEVSSLGFQPDLIASHGQTIKHEPPEFTLQIGAPQHLADKLKCPVVYDFRTADLEAGGQGAPLIPIVDRYLFQKDNEDVLALNIGGIANLTIVPSKLNRSPLLAWDTGPGNTLLDKAVRLYSNDKLLFDPDGSIASSGHLNTKLLDMLMNHEFYRIPPPRSAGQEQFGKTYFNEILKAYKPTSQQHFKDLIFTLTVLTSNTIAQSVNDLTKTYSPIDLLVGGGGCFNKVLMGLLKEELPQLEIKTVNRAGIDASNKEAFGFAYLGYLHLRNLPGNIPAVTGARKEVILGRRILPQL